MRDLVVAGKAFSLEIKLEDTSDSVSQVEKLIAESKQACKYSDKLSLRTQEEYIRKEYEALRSSIASPNRKQSPLKLSGSKKKMVVEGYEEIPDGERAKIERILDLNKAETSFRILEARQDISRSPYTEATNTPVRLSYSSMHPSFNGSIGHLGDNSQANMTTWSKSGTSHILSAFYPKN